MPMEQGMEKPFVRYGHQLRYFDPPPEWEILTLASFHDQVPLGEVVQLTRRALENPICSAPLRKRVNSRDKVAILIEDQTRYSPKQTVLRTLLELLKDARIPSENITVIVALGTHRPLTSKELASLYGEDLVGAYSFINHDCHAPELVPVASLKTGTRVKIHPKVHESTFTIGIGSIFPHPMNGFGGGGKILFPGVSNFDAILEHHLKHSFRRGSELGKLQGNPFYEEVCSLATKGGLDFIINSVLDHNDRLYDLVCGDPVEAHLEGVTRSRAIISKKFNKKADLTVISAFPYTEGTQLMKPLGPASIITKEGGVIILVGHCTAPLPDVYLEGCEMFRQKHVGHLEKHVLDLFDNNCRILEEGAPEFNMSLAMALLAQDKFKIIFVSEDVPREHVERLGFLFAADMDQAFALSEAFFPNPEVHIVPSGGVILPVLQKSEESRTI
jgi:nickel-dependent lactate racemase